MHVDYTQIFATPDELADFLLLEVEEQDRFLIDLVVTGKSPIWVRGATFPINSS